jgi:hypothetical protein
MSVCGTFIFAHYMFCLWDKAGGRLATQVHSVLCDAFRPLCDIWCSLSAFAFLVRQFVNVHPPLPHRLLAVPCRIFCYCLARLFALVRLRYLAHSLRCLRRDRLSLFLGLLCIEKFQDVTWQASIECGRQMCSDNASVCMESMAVMLLHIPGFPSRAVAVGCTRREKVSLTGWVGVRMKCNVVCMLHFLHTSSLSHEHTFYFVTLNFWNTE